MTSSNNKWPYPTLFAHRGGKNAPENTLAAIRTGRANGFLAVEFDVKLSSDSVAFLLHDDTLERTTNGAGDARKHTIAQLELLHANKGHEAAFPEEPVPRFTAVAKYLHGLGLLANVEIKPCPGREADTGRLVTELSAELWRDRFVKPLLSSFSAGALIAARSVSADLPLGVLLCEAGRCALATCGFARCRFTALRSPIRRWRPCPARPIRAGSGCWCGR